MVSAKEWALAKRYLEQGIWLGVVLEAGCQDGALLLCEDSSPSVGPTLS